MEASDPCYLPGAISFNAIGLYSGIPPPLSFTKLADKPIHLCVKFPTFVRRFPAVLALALVWRHGWHEFPFSIG
jgi:hypothetical protein